MTETAPSQKWTWNDASCSLELLSYNQGYDRQDKKKKDKREFRSNHRKGAGRKSPLRQGIKQTAEHTEVTLQDVKGVAKSMMLEVEDISTSFSGILYTPQFDEFLVFLLNYFHWFFAKTEKENITNPVHIEPSLAEKHLYEELCDQHTIAQKQLGRAYGILILGIGQCDHHHMECGRSHHSNTSQDRSKYESMYSFCTFFVWIAFKRRDHDIIKTEINRMLRTEHFSSESSAHQAPAAGQEDEEDSEKKLTTAEYRRKQRNGNRTSLKIIMNQRSATVVTMLPLPREESSWLFKRLDFHSEEASAQHKHMQVKDQLNQDFKHLDVARDQLKQGIIGEPLSQFDPVTLTSIDAADAETTTDKSQTKLTKTASIGSLTSPEEES